MGVVGSSGAGGAGAGRRRPSATAYYVALAGIMGLLLLLCGYFLYYFVRKILELRRVDTPTLTTTPRSALSVPLAPGATGGTAYPVQSVVRESASAMAKLCKQAPPPPGTGKGGTVFPTSTSPAAQHTDTGYHTEGAPQPEKLPVLAVPANNALEISAAR